MPNILTPENARNALAVVICAILMLLGGCGYQIAGEQRIAIPDRYRQVFITRVDNPSLETWLEPDLRAGVRDEFSRRGLDMVNSREEATSFLRVKISRFGSTSKVTDSRDQTVKHQAYISIEASLVSKGDNKSIWESGPVELYESYEGSDPSSASRLALELAIRRLGDRLAINF